MTRLHKYMLFNPKGEKPEKYFANLDNVLNLADSLRKKEKTDILVLKVVAIKQYRPSWFDEFKKSSITSIKKLIRIGGVDHETK